MPAIECDHGRCLGHAYDGRLYQFNIKATDTTAPTQFTFEKPYTLLITPAT